MLAYAAKTVGYNDKREILSALMDGNSVLISPIGDYVGKRLQNDLIHHFKTEGKKIAVFVPRPDVNEYQLVSEKAYGVQSFNADVLEHTVKEDHASWDSSTHVVFDIDELRQFTIDTMKVMFTASVQFAVDEAVHGGVDVIIFDGEPFVNHAASVFSRLPAMCQCICFTQPTPSLHLLKRDEKAFSTIFPTALIRAGRTPFDYSHTVTSWGVSMENLDDFFTVGEEERRILIQCLSSSM